MHTQSLHKPHRQHKVSWPSKWMDPTCNALLTSCYPINHLAFLFSPFQTPLQARCSPSGAEKWQEPLKCFDHPCIPLTLLLQLLCMNALRWHHLSLNDQSLRNENALETIQTWLLIEKPQAQCTSVQSNKSSSFDTWQPWRIHITFFWLLSPGCTV